MVRRDVWGSAENEEISYSSDFVETLGARSQASDV